MDEQQIRNRIREIELWRYRHITLPQREAREFFGCPTSVKFEPEVLNQNTRLVSEKRQLSDQLSSLYR